LTLRADDAIVVVPRKEAIMFWKTYDVFKQRVDYARSENGSWVAELSGAIPVRVEDASRERCRSRALETLEELLAEFLSARSSNAAGTAHAQDGHKTASHSRKRKLK